MSCRESKSWMMDAFDGTLAASNQRQLMAHLETCADCRAEWKGLNALEQMLANPSMALPAPDFVDRVEARLDRFEAQRRTLVGGLILLGAAAALCLLAVPSLLNGRNPIAAYSLFLRDAYELLGHATLLSYKLTSALWLALEAVARSADVSLLSVLTYAVGTMLAVASWRRRLISQRASMQMGRNGYSR